MCAAGARSPEAPSDPREGTQGTRSRVEHGAEQVDDLLAYPGVAFREGVDADRRGRSHYVPRQRLPHAYGVAAHKVLLQLAGLRDRHVSRGQLPKAGRHAVGDPLFAHDALDNGVGVGDACLAGIADAHAGSSASYRGDLLDRRGCVTEHYLVHRLSPPP